jgi:hypothetical protein
MKAPLYWWVGVCLGSMFEPMPVKRGSIFLSRHHGKEKFFFFFLDLQTHPPVVMCTLHGLTICNELLAGIRFEATASKVNVRYPACSSDILPLYIGPLPIAWPPTGHPTTYSALFSFGYPPTRESPMNKYPCEKLVVRKSCME